MRNTISIVLLCLGLVFGCTVPEPVIQTRVLSHGDTGRIEGYVYALPRTVFMIDVEIVKARTIRGPYYRFAEKYLSIRDVPSRNSTAWHIDRVELHPIDEADPGQVYLVSQVSGKSDLSAWLKLSEQGLIHDFRPRAASAGYQSSVGDGGPVFTDLSVMPNIVESEDNLFKTILTDSSFIQVPVTTQQLIVRTIDEKAREAADVILEIRQNRIEALSGKGNSAVGEAAIRRLDSLEHEYLSLFLGKKLTERQKHSYYLSPSAVENYENTEILEFSARRGILRERGNDSEVLSLATWKLEEQKIPSPPGTRTRNLTNALHYRIPEQAMVEVYLGEKVLISRRMPVYQYGSIVSMPVSAEIR